MGKKKGKRQGKGHGDPPQGTAQEGRSGQSTESDQQSVRERIQDVLTQERTDRVGIHEPLPFAEVPPEDIASGTSQSEQLSPTTDSRQEPAFQEAPESVSESTLSAKTFELAKRPGYGTLGKKINLIANYFKLNFKNISIYHYDVDIFFRKWQEESSKMKKDKAASIADEEEELLVKGLKKGISVSKQEKTRKKDIKEGALHVEHQQKKVPGKWLRRKVVTQMMLSSEYKRCNPIYDGEKNVYATRELPVSNKKTVPVVLEENGRRTEFDVVIQPVMKETRNNLINLEPLNLVYEGRSNELPEEVLMVFDTVLCHRSPPFLQIQVGRSFFLLDQTPHSLGRGAEIWFGYNQSVHLTKRGLQVLVNFSGKAFLKARSVIDFATDVLNNPTGVERRSRKDVRRMVKMSVEDIRKVKDALKDVRIRVTHLKRKPYTVEDLTKGAADIRFEIKKRSTTIVEYFSDTYNIQLKYPHLPCVKVKATKEIIFPMELCEIVRQPISGELPKTMAKIMIQEMAIPPKKRFEKIMGELSQLHKMSGEAMKAFGLNLEMNPMELSGRILRPPSLKYGDGSDPVSPDNCGRWKMNRNSFWKLGREACPWMLFSFAVISSDDRDLIEAHEKSLSIFANDMISFARTARMNLPQPEERKHLRNGENVSTILNYAKMRKVAFVVFVLSGQNKIYNEIKYLADIKEGLVTQCVVRDVVEKNLSKIPRDRFSYTTAVSNIILKLNYKLGGINHALLQQFPIFIKPIIIFGADVIHSVGDSSIAALVGSLDSTPAQYAVTCRIQKHRDEKKKSQEIILDLKNMTKSILETFINRTRGKKPEKIIFFRDGVSEGQFKTVLEREIRMVQEACVDALGGHVPPITFIIVQKRHQTRFRPRNAEDGVGRMENVPPGTTVDTDVTHPIFFDFFLCSHEGIQGTSKPAHYTVIFDENSFSADALQNLCYHLCYVYARCNRSISIPPPVMYADLACTRASKYVSYLKEQNPATPKFSVFRELPKDAVDTINGVSTIKLPMFFI